MKTLKMLAGIAIFFMFLISPVVYAQLESLGNGLVTPSVKKTSSVIPGTIPGIIKDGVINSSVKKISSILPKIIETGKINLSVDGLAMIENTGNIQVKKPTGATVRAAYFLAATTGGRNYQLADGDITLDGVDIVWDKEIVSSISSWNYWADVTSTVKSLIDAAPAGIINIEVSEVDTYDIDGTILAVIFDDPNQTLDNTVVLIFGAQATSGDFFNIELANPIDKSDPDLSLEMSLGISFGFQLNGNGEQYSIVEVNNKRLTTSAGGQDDSSYLDPGADGALLTVGGIGDDKSNPPDPYAYAYDWSSDDELYDLLPFVNNGDKQISIYTQNPSDDDNIFFASLFLASTTAVLGEGIVLSPSSAKNYLGTEHTVTAKVQDYDGAPVPDRNVDFAILSGPNSGMTGSGMTDVDGMVSFTYTGTTKGTDLISASFVNNKGDTVYSNRVTKVWTDELIVSVYEAATRGWINMYCYPWDGTQYTPISGNPADATSSTSLSPWTGFFVVPNRDVDLLFPKVQSNPNPPAAKQAVAFNPSLTVDPERWYLFSVPLIPTNGDIFANFGDDFVGNYESTWRVSKWNHLYEAYENYTGPASIPDLLPGRGFWVYHINDTSRELDLEGEPVNPAGDYYEMKLPVKTDGSPSYHMSGNPYLNDIFWANCKVRTPMTDGLPLSKIAAGDIQSWSVDLKLQSDDGKALDTYNRAGVMMTEGAVASVFNAVDMLPPGDYIRLTLKNPSDSESSPLAYSYQEFGKSEYTWTVELTTTYPSIDTRLSLQNIAKVPEGYTLTLKDNFSGEVITLGADMTIPVSLSSATPRTFTLIATLTQKPTGVEESKPLAFGITGVNPNPFNPNTSITFNMEREAEVTVKIFSTSGQLVATLVNSRMSAGMHTVNWNANGHGSGVYLAMVQSGGKIDTRKITLMK